MKTKKALYLIGGILLAAALIVGLYFGIQALKNKTAHSTPSSTEAGTEVPGTTSSDASQTPEGSSEAVSTTEALELPKEVQAVKIKEVYTVDDLKSDDPRLDQIVATCGDSKLNNRQAQIYYFFQFYGFMREYGNYITMLGIDLTKPLSEQEFIGGDMSWEQFFLMSGMQSYQQYAAISAKAEAEDYQLPEEDAEELGELRSNMEKEAAQYGYESVDAYLQASFGAGVRYEDYEEYLHLYYTAFSYENELYENISVTEQEMKAYFEAHPDVFEGLDPEIPNISVRHILISSDSDNDGETSEEERSTAQAKAQELLAGLRSNPSEEYFSELAKENTDDPGSKSTGGLYEDVYPGQMVPAFDEWCFNKDRKPGDMDVVETSYGFHVMYFVKQTDTYHWKTTAEENIKSETMDKLIGEILTPMELKVNYQDVILAPIPQGEEE